MSEHNPPEQPEIPNPDLSEYDYYQVKNVRMGEKTVKGRVIGRGENKRVIPEAEVAKLAQYHCTDSEMADFYDVPLSTFRDNFRKIIDKNRILTKQRLRKAQLDLALRGDRVMLIWLGKQLLGQSENPVSSESEQILPWTSDE